MNPRFTTTQNGVFIASVPTLNTQKPLTKRFHPSKYHDPFSACVLWRDKTGREYWGARIWDAIMCRRITTTALRGTTSGVYVYKADNRSENNPGVVWRVEWRLNGVSKAKIFGVKRFGTLEAAEVEANLFAAEKRAELIGQSVQLPTVRTNQAAL